MRQIFRLSLNSWKNVALLLALFPLALDSFRHIVSNNHWLGSEACYDYWTLNEYQWGAGIIQNVGPLAFLHYPLSFTGFLDGEKFFADVSLSFVLVCLVVYILRFIKNKYLVTAFVCSFVSVQLVKTPLTFAMPTEVNHYLLSLLVAYVLFLTDAGIVTFLLVAFLALISLGKGLFLFTSLFTVAVLSAKYVVQRRYAFALALSSFYLATMAAIWMLVGQRIANLSEFIVASFAFSSGYAEALTGYDPSWACFSLALLLVLSVSAKFWHVTRRHSGQQVSLVGLLGLVELFIAFAAWKHGIIAEDGYHRPVFIYYAVLALPLYLSIVPGASLPGWVWDMAQDNGPATRGHFAGSWRLLARSPLAGYAGVVILVPLSTGAFLQGWNFIFTFDEKYAAYAVELRQSIETMRMPLVKSIVADAPVSYFGELPAPMVYNGFNYHPTPATISFVGWNPWLIRKDAAFFEDNALAPTYLVYQLYNVADVARQFSPLDSPLAQLAILQRYDPVMVSGAPVQELGSLLLQRRQGVFPALSRQSVLEGGGRVGQMLAVPADAQAPLAVTIKMREGLLAALVKFFYKPADYVIEYVLDDGRRSRRKFTPAKAAFGFLVAPFILENKDFIAAMSSREWEKFEAKEQGELRRMVSFTIECEHLKFICSEVFDLSIARVDGLDLGRLDSSSIRPISAQ